MADTRINFDQFVTANVDGLLRTAYLIAGDETEAEDLVQESLMKLARRWPRARTLDQPLAYTRRILINLAIDGSRARARRLTELDPGSQSTANNRRDENSTDDLATLHTRAELVDALGALPARQRAALVLRCFLDLSEAQAADALGCSEGTVKSSTSRGLARLRHVLQPEPLRKGTSHE